MTITSNPLAPVRLIRRNPTTVVIETPKFWLLFSYQTLIAYDDKETSIISFCVKDESGHPFGKNGNTTISSLNWFLGRKWKQAILDGTAKEVTRTELEAMV